MKSLLKFFESNLRDQNGAPLYLGSKVKYENGWDGMTYEIYKITKDSFHIRWKASTDSAEQQVSYQLVASKHFTVCPHT